MDTDHTVDVFLRVRDFSGSNLALVALVDPKPVPTLPTLPTQISECLRSSYARILRLCNPVHTVANFRGLCAPSTSAPLQAYKACRCALVFGGGGIPPSLTFLAVWGEGGYLPRFRLHACTPCMHVFCEDRGVFRGLLAGVFGDCPPDPARNRYFRGVYPAEGEGAA